ncbi:MAG: hypothetical protein A3I05_00020 [Deltaproteobacteria bacterium RIFCSPLOWO2_02_FULL_44_10]|nr:MAG: hypothetical protein A3C46_02630 [Deltaproteobacteria bacterium RIFCSPHIGHO2_02_FULL_44_16]OGQ45560.1 MAG: hypothetical protein A3I05_00020 [Deltaproteobacteria bacterium RIFCSPLOWO2_02_FULL_44_10]
MTSIFLYDISLYHVPFVQKYAADKLIADTTSSIPHPYPEGAAKLFIQDALRKQKTKENFVYAVYASAHFVGIISLFHCDWKKREAEIGYWIGVPFWGKGYATEALSQLIMKAKGVGLKILIGKCLVRNFASRRVMEKNGFVCVKKSVGCGQHVHEKKWEFKYQF